MKPKVDLRGLNENYKEDLFIVVAKCRTLLRKMNYDDSAIREFTLNAWPQGKHRRTTRNLLRGRVVMSEREMLKDLVKSGDIESMIPLADMYCEMDTKYGALLSSLALTATTSTDGLEIYNAWNDFLTLLEEEQYDREQKTR